jgi:ureidoglycolate hydrolase
MTNPPAHLVEIGSFFAEGYRPVLDFHGWRVAMLRSIDGVQPEAFSRVERHRETNEVFILTAGQADLIVCDGDTPPGEAFVASMEHNVAYNIGQYVWHNVVMSPDAHIILFERTGTGDDNSDFADLSPEQIAAISAQFRVGRGDA